ncbi:MAG TPA: zinc-ribbon domain-containing protein [Terriglobales bacterium]|nr:zinc-ribbon domain-containing protein [Terriglobales bacterium]
MFCNQCGSALTPGVVFCPNCGRAVGTAPAPMPPAVAAVPSAVGRVARHRNILGALWLVRALFTLPGGLVLVGFSSFHQFRMDGMWGAPFSHGQFPLFLGPLLGGIGWGIIVFAVVSAIVGVGLLQAQSWGRMLAIVMGVINLISIPLGTALGIYTLWVLMPDQSEVEYRAMVRS